MGRGLNDVSLGSYTDGQVPRKRCLTLARNMEMTSEKWCVTPLHLMSVIKNMVLM